VIAERPVKRAAPRAKLKRAWDRGASPFSASERAKFTEVNLWEVDSCCLA
jgi:hypothetical protein